MPPSHSYALSDLIAKFQNDQTHFTLKDESSTFSKQEILERVSGLQRVLLARGAQKQERIAVLCGAGASQVISMLSVWSLGAIYVPISIDNSAARIQYILEDCQIRKVMIVDSSLVERLGLSNMDIIHVQEALKGDSLKKGNLSITEMKDDETAYICYTSGSTGKPKGVLISNRSVKRLLQSTDDMFHWLTEKDIHLQTLDYSFDISIWNLLIWLLKGGTLISASFENNVAKLISLMVTHRPTFICNAAPTYGLLMASKKLWQRHNVDSPKTILTVASYCLPKTALELLETFPSARLFNCYGPTETTVYCCWTEITRDLLDLTRPLSIGYVMPGNRAWLYNGTDLQQADRIPEGEERELCISGDHVCQGYWNAPKLNADKFLTSSSGERVYRTGDLVFRKNIHFYYLGRMDDTIKVKGYRVNLSEIELCIGALDWISACVVIDLPAHDYQSELTAVYMLKGEESRSPTETSAKIKDYCAQQLPSYMVPSKFHPVQQWPMTASGKIDRLALKKALTLTEGSSLSS